VALLWVGARKTNKGYQKLAEVSMRNNRGRFESKTPALWLVPLATSRYEATRHSCHSEQGLHLLRECSAKISLLGYCRLISAREPGDVVIF